MPLTQSLHPSITPECLKDGILQRLVLSVGKDPDHASPRDWLIATSLAVRDHLVPRWMNSTRQIDSQKEKRVYYLSMEFLVGRLLIDTLANLGLRETCAQALRELGQSLDELKELEPDAALGNGGLGRLAACFLESMGSVGIAGFGYGIRYDHGLFRQHFDDEGRQVEKPENWLSFGNPWQFERPEVAYEIGFGGKVETVGDPEGRRAVWSPGERILAVAFDTPVAGWQGRRVNTLRLWSARSPELMQLDTFNRGDYVGALADQARAESISLVLYPDDSTPIGQELRLKQEYFFTSASLQDLIRRHLSHYDSLASLPDKAAIQLNDTHPALAVPELMRLLIDQHDLPWDEAWLITRGCIAYTNHTLLPEALETWPVALMERLLPRHMEIIELLHADQMAAMKREGITDAKTIRDVALISDMNGHRVRMGNLAFLGAHRVNGVSALHTELMKKTVFSTLHGLFPDRIVSETNGITPRRWLLECNPGLSALITEAIGDGWPGDLEQLAALAPLADDAAFRERYAAVKQANKTALSHVIEAQTGLRVDAGAMFDVQIKRIHEYKRQLLNILETIAHYNAIRAEPSKDWQPRVKIFGGKAAASYHMAKLIINLINNAARAINRDPVVGDRLKVVFLPDYRVSLAEKIIPAADLSEQISTAGMEASGTGNMKFALNGALTIGTLDGANIEIMEHFDAENIFIFGLTAEEVMETRRAAYDPAEIARKSAALSEVLDQIRTGVFSPDDSKRYHALVDNLMTEDYFRVTVDFDAYAAMQRRIDETYGEREDWVRKAVLNTAHSGWFSSDRTIRGCARDIWGIDPDKPRGRP
ncbi:MAG: glycogen/starch/alpha-glucan phosphorylase [Rhodomicrobiaceae bacterium]